jgi:hypothetical protein
MEIVASLVVLIAFTVFLWLYTGQPEYRKSNRVMVRVFWGAALLYFLYKMFWTQPRRLPLGVEVGHVANGHTTVSVKTRIKREIE